MNQMIYSALKGEAALGSLLGTAQKADGTATQLPAIFHAAPPSFELLPAVSFLETGQRSTEFADDMPLSKEWIYEICIYAKGSTQSIFEQVNAVMERLGFCLASTQTITEPDLIIRKCSYKIVTLL